MAWARLLVFGAALLALVLPGHPLVPGAGLPLDVPAIVAVGLIVGWWIALPGLPPRPGLLVSALALLAVSKLVLAILAPSYGAFGEYRSGTRPVGTETEAPDTPGTNRRDLALDFQGDTFPVHFFNDVRRFNYYTANDPKRDLLPFAVRWSGALVVPTGGVQTLTLEANGPATLQLGTGQRVSVEQSGRVREVALTADLPAGVVPLTVTYVRPDEAMPWLVVRAGQPGTDAPPLAAPALVASGTTTGAVARDTWLRPLGVLVQFGLAGVLLAAFAMHAWKVPPGTTPHPPPPSPARGRGGARLHLLGSFPGWGAYPGHPTGLPFSRVRERGAGGEGSSRAEGAGPPLALPERLFLACYLLAALGRELLAHLHLHGRAVLLSGGNDWLAYEGFARDILAHGPLLAEGRPLGQGVPFYYQPLYIYWVALSHGLLGEGLFAPLFMNAALGVLTGLLLYLLTRDLFDRASAVVVVLLFEAYRLTVFAPTAGLLLSENLLFPLVPAVLLLLARAVRGGRLTTLAGAGAVLGLAGLARTTPLALLPPALLILVFGLRRLRLSWPQIGGRLALLVLVCMLTVGLATTRNYLVSGRPVPITSSAGANLWETHRPTSKVDLSQIDRDPLYERLGLDRQTREVVEFVRQDPAGYVGTLVPMFLYAVGVVGAVRDSWEVHPGLLGMCLAYLLLSLLVRRARSLPTWFLHAFVWSHLAQMTVFFSHQYGFRLILPMYVAMVPIVAGGLVALARPLARRLAPFAPSLPLARAPLPPAARISLLLLGLLGAGASLGAGGIATQEARREAFYGLNGDALLATRQAAHPDLLRRADITYFAGEDSRSTDVAYLRGLAFPNLRWFDGARGLVLPPAGEMALYVLPERAAADVARRCLGEDAALGRERDPERGAVLDLYLSAGDGDACTVPRLVVGAPFAETARLVGLDAPASLEPGQTLDLTIHWQVTARPDARSRPFARLVDGAGRRWGEAETTVYPSSSWRPGERVLGQARLEVDPTLPPGTYRLQAGFTAGSDKDRLAEDGPWGSAGLTRAEAGDVRLVSRSAPLPAEGLPLDRRADATFDGVRLLGADLERESARAGEWLRVGLFWQNAAGRLDPREVSVALRRPDGAIVQEWRGVPVDGAYPTTSWLPNETVRDTWDLLLPVTLPAGDLELVAALVAPGSAPRYQSLGTIEIQSVSRHLEEPSPRQRADVRFEGGAQLLGAQLKRRPRPGENLELTLFWRAAEPIREDQAVLLSILDENGRVLAQDDGEPAGGRRPTRGWTTDEYVEDGWRLRLPRDAPRSGLRVAVALVDVADGRRVPTLDGRLRAELPLDGAAE